jgi:hypothetical protein
MGFGEVVSPCATALDHGHRSAVATGPARTGFNSA